MTAPNVAGTGINVAQAGNGWRRCGHILFPNMWADDLAQYRHWRLTCTTLGVGGKTRAET